MRHSNRRSLLAETLCGLLLVFSGEVRAEEMTAAVASNFKSTARTLAAQFESATGHRVVLLFGSSGKHFAQISEGAPVDVFLSADSERVARLEAAGRTVPGSRFVYAIGRLVLWSPEPGLVDDAGAVLAAAGFEHLAMANPRLAPYGQAALEVLTALELQDRLAAKIVRGENIEQTFQFITSGNAQLGFVARSQLVQSAWGQQGSRWEVPQALYAPIRQEAVQVRATDTARAFLLYLRGPEARKLILEHGYDVP